MLVFAGKIGYKGLMRTLFALFMVVLLATSQMFAGAHAADYGVPHGVQHSSLIDSIDDLMSGMGKETHPFSDCCDKAKHSKHMSASLCAMDCKWVGIELNSGGKGSQQLVWDSTQVVLTGLSATGFLRPPIS